MARWGHAPGGTLTSKNDGKYWVRLANQNARYEQTSRNAVERFNEKWKRINRNFDLLKHAYTNFFEGVEFDKKGERKLEKIEEYLNKAWENHDWIAANLQTAKIGAVSKYATQVKNFGLNTLKVAIEYELCDHVSVEYIAADKTIYVDGEAYYYFG